VIKALAFDVFGTLFDWRTSLIDSFETFGRERGLTADWPALVETWREAYAPSMDLVRRGLLPWANLDALHRSSFDELAPRFGLEGLDERARAECVLFWHNLKPWPDVRAGMARLRERFVVATLSNGSVALLVDLARHADVRFDAILSAEIFRHYKPDPETYRGALELLGVAPGELMLVAAHNGDLRAAAAWGLRTAFLARPEWGPRQVSDLTADDGVDVVARDLCDLAERLGN
jgi:2-haloacid dehalogenase